MENMDVDANKIVVFVRTIIVFYIDVLKGVNPDITNTRLLIITFAKNAQIIVSNVMTQLYVGYAMTGFI
jgi:hypothetical protein